MNLFLLWLSIGLYCAFTVSVVVRANWGSPPSLPAHFASAHLSAASAVESLVGASMMRWRLALFMGVFTVIFAAGRGALSPVLYDEDEED